MSKTKQFALSVGMGTALVLAAVSGSLAQQHYYEHDDNGTVWSYYPGYTDQQGPLASQSQRNSAATTAARAAQARAAQPRQQRLNRE